MGQIYIFIDLDALVHFKKHSKSDITAFPIKLNFFISIILMYYQLFDGIFCFMIYSVFKFVLLCSRQSLERTDSCLAIDSFHCMLPL